MDLSFVLVIRIFAGWCESEHAAILAEAAFAPRWRPCGDSEHAYVAYRWSTGAGSYADWTPDWRAAKVGCRGTGT
jgi:hypothetical protein